MGYDDLALGPAQRIDGKLAEQKSLLVGISRGLDRLADKRSPGKPKPEARPGRILLKAAVSELLRPISYSSGSAVTFEKSAGEVGRELYPGDHDLHAWITRAAVSPATTTGVGFAAELLSSSTIDFLTGDDAASGFSALAAQTLNVPIEGTVRVPRRAHPATLSASWTTENAPKPVYALSLSSIQLTANKITAISAWSDEIGQWSVPAIEQVVADSLRRDINGLLDSTAFGTAAASGAAPAGLFNGATAVTASTATPLSEAMLADLGALQAAVAVGAPDSRPLFIANGKQGLRLNAAGFGNVIISNYMPVGSIGVVDSNSVITMLGNLQFLASSNATLHMSDSPLALATGVQGSGVLATPISSAFQQNLVALRSILYCGWKLRRSGASALATSVTW